MPKTITDNALSATAKHVFLALKEHARGRNWPECWPSKWQIAEEIGKSHRSVERGLYELEQCGAIEIIRSEGKRSRYKILLRVQENIADRYTNAPPTRPPTPMSGVLSGVLSGVMSGVAVSSIIEEAKEQQAVQSAEPPALAAEEKIKGEEMIATTKSAFDELVKMGLPASAEIENRIALNPDHAREVLRHCKRRFGKGKKPVDNPGGYIAALLKSPEKFGWVQRDGVWCDPEKPSGPTAEEVAARIDARKAATRKLLSDAQIHAEEAYLSMKASWENLPEEARQEIREFVQKDSPLFHNSGDDEVEFVLQCMREAITFRRAKWRQKWLGK